MDKLTSAENLELHLPEIWTWPAKGKWSETCPEGQSNQGCHRVFSAIELITVGGIQPELINNGGTAIEVRSEGRRQIVGEAGEDRNPPGLPDAIRDGTVLVETEAV